METKQKHDNDKPVVHSPDALRTLLCSAITSHGSVEVALLHIMKTHDLSAGLLERVLTKNRIKASFFEVKYGEIAPFVGLHPDRNMHDIETFRLHRSRIPTALFKSIVQDIDVMMAQYGPLIEHNTEAATSQFLSPIFNRLIALFGFAFRNVRESIINSRITTKGRVEHFFKMIGSISVLFIEMRFRIYRGNERLNAIAQVIAECGACDWNNTQRDIRVPVYGILCDGNGFEFFLFDGTTEPFSFKRGLGPNDRPTRPQPFLLDSANTSTTRPFTDALRPICEIIFDLLLRGYVSNLKAYHNCSVNKSVRVGQPRQSVDKWDVAVSAAVKASQDFRDAETKRQTQLTDEANSIVEGAMTSLKSSVDVIQILDKPRLIMSDWDDEEIEKV